ncbi:MAG: outer membrane lipoprotein carrier protein LolA [Deltaproteobacteria bacterium]|nr:outer membrane lipoprotein carrier protein LolA [Deltaproteobacteria bacterium]
MKKINNFNILLMLATVLVSFIFVGWSKDWDQLRKDAEQINTIRSDFVQEKHLQILSRPLISKGVFYYEAPGSLRWEYQSPIRSILLMHEARVTRYIWGENGFRRDSGLSLQAMQIVLQEITKWLGGHFDDNPDFTASLEPDRRIVLTPKKKALSAIIKNIELILSDRPGVIKSVTIYEGEKSFTKIIFKNVRVNEVLKETVFQF